MSGNMVCAGADFPSIGGGWAGRRLHTAEFKRQHVDRVLKGEIAAAELSRELGVARSLIQRWKYLATWGAEAAVGSNGDVVPLTELRAAQGWIKELERLVGKLTLELEILRGARDEAKRRPRYYGVSAKRPEAPSR